MKTRWHLVLFLVLGSAFVSCAEEALDQAMVPDGGDDGDGRVSHADVPAEAGACCEPEPPPARVVLFDAPVAIGEQYSPVVDVSGYRRIVVHTTCASSSETVEMRHGVAGFLENPDARLCSSGVGFRRMVTLDPQLGVELRVTFTNTGATHPLTIVGYR